jgi:hypothetical protein
VIEIFFRIGASFAVVIEARAEQFKQETSGAAAAVKRGKEKQGQLDERARQRKEEGQTIQWSKEGQTIQWSSPSSSGHCIVCPSSIFGF